MIESNLEVLVEALQKRRFFGECLLHDMRLTRVGFGVDLVFNYVWDRDNQIRSDVLQNLDLITITLLGVESLNFVGALTSGMIMHPERINWGLSEVARVEAVRLPATLKIFVRWEGERRIEVEFNSFELEE